MATGLTIQRLLDLIQKRIKRRRNAKHESTDILKDDHSWTVDAALCRSFIDLSTEVGQTVRQAADQRHEATLNLGSNDIIELRKELSVNTSEFHKASDDGTGVQQWQNLMIILMNKSLNEKKLMKCFSRNKL